jgi:hypothetical protein
MLQQLQERHQLPIFPFLFSHTQNESPMQKSDYEREEMLRQKISISIITYLSAGLGGAEEVVLRGVLVVLVA